MPSGSALGCVRDWIEGVRGFASLGLVAASAFFALVPTATRATDVVMLRGRPQVVHLYGMRGGDPVIVSSGDGGWIHLGPQVAATLASAGCFVVGFDVKAYLESFTSGAATLRAEDEPTDYRTLAEYAARGASRKPILIGVSEGAGLSVLAASDPSAKRMIAGVIGLGLTERNELGWRWKDAAIYLTHGVPDEPTFATSSVIARIGPLPLAAIQSTGDEFASPADVERAIARASEPKRLWIVPARDHRFSDNEIEFDRRLLEALAWVRANAPA